MQTENKGKIGDVRSCSFHKSSDGDTIFQETLKALFDILNI